MKTTYVYCDGGVTNNGSFKEDIECWGSFCAIILNKSDTKPQKTFCELHENTTNNQMELLGAIRALNYLHEYMNNKFPTEKLNVIVTSDSQYLVKGMNEWLSGWKKKGWRDSSGNIVKNIELWKELDKINRYSNLIITFNWIRGHKGKSCTIEDDRDAYFNELCDTILSEELKPYRNKKKKGK